MRCRHRVLMRGMGLSGRVLCMLMARMKRKHGCHDHFSPSRYAEKQQRRDGFLQHAKTKGGRGQTGRL
jgi:hypothetical protein